MISASERRRTASADGLRESAAVDEIGVGEMGVPVEIVVDGMIDSAAVLAAEAEIERCDAHVIDEARVIGAGAEGADAQVARAGGLPGDPAGGWVSERRCLDL